MAGKMPEISVNLKLDSAAFSKGFAKAQKSMSNFEKNSKKMSSSLRGISNSLGKLKSASTHSLCWVGYLQATRKPSQCSSQHGQDS